MLPRPWRQRTRRTMRMIHQRKDRGGQCVQNVRGHNGLAFARAPGLQMVAEGSRDEILRSARMKTNAAKWLGTGPDLQCQLVRFALIVLDTSGCRIMLNLHAHPFKVRHPTLNHRLITSFYCSMYRRRLQHEIGSSRSLETATHH